MTIGYLAHGAIAPLSPEVAVPAFRLERLPVWSFHLQPHWEGRVRLLTRARIALRHPGEVFAVDPVRPVIALSTRGLLLEIKHRVEWLPMTKPTYPAPGCRNCLTVFF